MSKIKLSEVQNENLKEVDILWSEKYSCPIYILADGKRYIPMTGEFAGYYEEVSDDQ